MLPQTDYITMALGYFFKKNKHKNPNLRTHKYIYKLLKFSKMKFFLKINCFSETQAIRFV